MHLDDEILRAYLDRSLEPAESGARQADIQDHLNACPDCRARLAALAARSARLQAHLAVLDPGPGEAAHSASSAFALLTTRHPSLSGKENLGMLSSLFTRRWRPLWIGLSALVLFTVAFSFPPVRAWAGSLLAQFRVQNITVVPVDATHLSELGTSSTIIQQISQAISDSMTVTKKPMKPQVAPNAAEAGKLAGFTVRLPQSRTDAPRITVEGGSAFEFVVNRARAQALLNEAGFSQPQLPASIDKAVIKVNIPVGITAAYGDCPNLDEGTTTMNASGSAGRRFLNCVLLAEIPSPTVDTPPNVDVEQLAEIGLQFTGMSPEDAHAYSATVDWASTLVVPIPRNGASYKQVGVDGVTGYLIQRPVDDAPQYVLVWVKSGIIYAIGGLGNGADNALAMANSLK